MSDEDIRKSAYARWEAEGRPEGHHDRHWLEAEQEANGTANDSPQTWSSDHDGGVSPATKTDRASDDKTGVEEPANSWPAADDKPGLPKS